MQGHRQPRGADGAATAGQFAVRAQHAACFLLLLTDAPLDRYGVSRVYNQQCGYTLLDAQAMHDKMTSMLKILPGGGLDPSAGKTK